MTDTRPRFRISLMRKITMSIAATGTVITVGTIAARYAYTAKFLINTPEWLLVISSACAWAGFLAAYVRDDNRRTMDAVEVRIMQRFDETDDHISDELGTDHEAPTAAPAAANVTHIRSTRSGQRHRVLTPAD